MGLEECSRRDKRFTSLPWPVLVQERSTDADD